MPLSILSVTISIPAGVDVVTFNDFRIIFYSEHFQIGFV